MKNGSVTPEAGATVRQDFSGHSLSVQGETASAAVAAQAQAAVQARYVMAMQRPRDWDVVRQRLLSACRRPGFADAAIYRKPIGKGIEGLSIRFAEEALRNMGNCYPETSVIYEDRLKRIVRVSLTDLEANLTFSKDIVVEKTVERSKLREGQEAIAERSNSYGKKVFVVEATEDDLLNKQAALESKALRSHALRLLPGDIADEAEALIRHTMKDRAAKDPSAERKRLVDAFGAIGVSVDDLKKYVGHALEQLVPAELVELRMVFQTLKDGEARWSDQLEAKLATRKKDAKKEPEPAAQKSEPASAESEAAAPDPEPENEEDPIPPSEATVDAPAAPSDDPTDGFIAQLREAAKQGKRPLNTLAHKAKDVIPADRLPEVLEIWKQLSKGVANA